MATQQMPPSGITLHGAPNISNKDKGNSAIARSAVLLRLNEQVIADLKTCSDTGRVLQLLSGKAPVRTAQTLWDMCPCIITEPDMHYRSYELVPR